MSLQGTNSEDIQDTAADTPTRTSDRRADITMRPVSVYEPRDRAGPPDAFLFAGVVYSILVHSAFACEVGASAF